MLLKASEMLLQAPGICLQSQLQLQRLLLWLCGDTNLHSSTFLSVTLATKCLRAFLASNQTSQALSSTGHVHYIVSETYKLVLLPSINAYLEERDAKPFPKAQVRCVSGCPGTAPRSRCERCSAHRRAGLSLGRHRRTVCKASRRKEKSHLRAAALALVLLLELQLKPKPHRSGQGTSQRHSLLTALPTSARRLRRVQAERRGRRLPSLLFVLLPQHRCVIKRRHIIKHRHVQIKAAKQRLTPRSQQTPRPQAPRPYPPTSPGSPSEQLGSQCCSPITFSCLFIPFYAFLCFLLAAARLAGASFPPPRVGTHRQLHADVGAVEQRHPAGEHGPGLAGGGDVRGCALRLPQPLPLGVPPGRAPAQGPPEEAQHRCGSPHSMGRKKKMG